MRILHYLGVWYIFIAVLLLCAHRPFIALCHETTGSSNTITSGKPKSESSTADSGADSAAKVPSGQNKKDVGLDTEDEEETDNSVEETGDDLNGKTNEEDTAKDDKGKPTISSSGRSDSDEHDPLIASDDDDDDDTSSSHDANNKEDVSGSVRKQNTHSLQDIDTAAKKSSQDAEGEQGIKQVSDVAAEINGEEDGTDTTITEVNTAKEDLEEDASSSTGDDEIALSASDVEKPNLPDDSEKPSPEPDILKTDQPSTQPEPIDPLPDAVPLVAPDTVGTDQLSPLPSKDETPGEETKPDVTQGDTDVVIEQLGEKHDGVVSDDDEDHTGTKDKETEPDIDELSANEKQPSVDEKQPTPDEKQPTPDERQPTPEERQPPVDEKQPTPDEKQPTPDEKQPTPDEKQPPVDEKQPTPDEKQPTPDETEEKKPDDMPSFDEWKEKMLQEEEQKKKEQGQASKSHAAPPVRPKFSLTENSKNHASADCGAKILSTNKEAQSPTAILNINPDLYMLNPCSAKIKFVVELCEPIQVKQIEIANYELFSSVPESFRVSISDRYPAREWHLMGTFHARNERVLHSFPLHDETMFAKYMKIEMLTFFGSEHYCPLSVLRVFGTNVVEEIEDADADADDIGVMDPPEVLPLHPTPTPDDERENNLLENARDVVLDLVKRAAKVLTGREADADKWRDEHMPCMPEDGPNVSVNATDNLPLDSDDLPYQEHLEICMPSIYNQCVGIDVDFSSMRQLCRGHSCCFCPNYAERFEYCRSRGMSQNAQDAFQCCKDTNLCNAKRDGGGGINDGVPGDVGDQKLNEMLNGKEELKVEDNVKVMSRTESEVERTAKLINTKPKMETVVSEKSNIPSRLDDDNSMVLPKDETLVVMTAAPSLVQPIVSVVINVSSLRDIQPTKSMQPAAPAKTETANSQDAAAAAAPQVVVVETEKAGVVKLEPTGDVNQGATTKSDSVNKTPSIGENEQKVVDKGADSKQEVPPQVLSDSNSAAKQVDKVDKQDAGASNTDKAAKTDNSAKAEGAAKADSTGKADGSAKAESSAKVDSSAKADSSAKTDASVKVSKPSVDIGLNGGGGGSGILSSHQKESVFMRLNNRIKSLEVNMSLSSRYLEELSQRYRKQMEEMQKAFNKTITTLTDNAQTAQERDNQQQAYINQLESKLDDITSQLLNTSQRVDVVIREVIERHLFLMLIEIVVMSLLFLFCIGRRPHKIYIPVENNGVVSNHVRSTPVPNHVKVKDAARSSARSSTARAHSSDEGTTTTAMHASPGRRRNRSFDECTPVKASATNTGGGSCDDLLIIGHTTPFLEAVNQVDGPDGAPKRKGKHKSRHKGATKSSSSSSLSYANASCHHNGRPITEDNQAGLLFRGSAQQKVNPDTSSGSSTSSGTINNSAIKRLFGSASMDRIQDLVTAVTQPATKTLVAKIQPQPAQTEPKQPHPAPIGPNKQPQHSTQLGPRQLHKSKHQKTPESYNNSNSLTQPLPKQSNAISSSIPSTSQVKHHGKGVEKKSRASPGGLQQKPQHQIGGSGTKRASKKTSPVIDGKR